MQPLDQVTIGQIITYGRDLSIAGVILKLGWEARGVIESLKTFGADVHSFMGSVNSKLDTLNQNVNLAMTNHLPHFQEHLELIASGKAANDKVSEHVIERLAADSTVDSGGPGPQGSVQA
jgi:hypothetical protein